MIRLIKRYIKLRLGVSSFSQCGEDLILNYIFRSRGVSNPNYLDIGAYHPLILSNTQLFYKKGSVGVNIEPNSNRFNEFLKCRKRDVNLNVGVGINDGYLKYFIFQDSTLNSFSEDEVKNYERLRAETRSDKYKLIGFKDVKIVGVNSVLEKYFTGGLDILTIDAEGMDFQIIKAIDFEKFNIKIFCVESVEHSANGLGKKRKEIVEFLTLKNYHEVAFTGLNSIFAKNEFYFDR